LESTPKNTGKNNKSRKKETEKSDENGKRFHISSSEKTHKGIAHFTSPMGLRSLVNKFIIELKDLRVMRGRFYLSFLQFHVWNCTCVD
jgi:hypothetical protein